MPTLELLGRARELEELEARARRHRLVTVVGPGGVGKTALAKVAASRVGDSFPLGVRLVDLTRIEDDRAVPGALAAQLGFDSFDSLLSSPNDRPLLLVVDNCEHLLDAAAASIVRLLGACHQPTVVATSRSPLEIPGESVLSLAPLPMPSPTEDPATCPSVQLFLQRCRDAGAVVPDHDLAAVVELCRQLDGLPLALEIAAARARTMSIPEIAARLGDSVDVLDRPRFRGDPRHRSVADTIKWSYDLLDPGPAELFEQLAVFSGPFAATAARTVAGATDAGTSATGRFDTNLDELVHASLVSVDTGGPETRFRLFDTVRGFALDRLRSRDAFAAAHDRFVDHVVATTRQTVAGATSSWRPDLLRDLVDSFDDIAEALRWCNAHDTTARRAHMLCSVLWGIAHQGHADDIVELARETLTRWPDRSSRHAARALAVLATAEYVTGHPARAVTIAEAALAALAVPDVASVTLRRVLGQARRALGDLPGALDAFRTGSAIGSELGMPAMAAELDIAAALVVADEGDVERSLAILTDIVERATSAPSTITESWARTALAWVHVRVDPQAARPKIDHALMLAKQLDYPVAVAANLRSRAFAEILLDDLAAATATTLELLDDLLGRGALSNARLLADVAAVIAFRCGDPGWETLAATARALPITTIISAHYELVSLPATTAPVIARHDVIAVVRNVLAELTQRPAENTVLAAPTTASTPEPSAPVAVTDPAVPDQTTEDASIRRRGDVGEITFAGRSVSLRTTKGLNDLIRLIAAAGRELHCLDLADAGVEQGSTGDVIDATARQEYEQRIRDLQAELAEAEADNDYARAYRYQIELDTILDHLTAALGQGNRTRRAADNAERARTAVTHRLRATIRQLAKTHPALGRHLTHAINTGFYCSYRPENPTTWLIE